MRRNGLVLILILAFLLRTFALDRFPVGFTPDEASFGYDAFSLLNTGKDQWGKTLPLVLESFGDFKPPLYAYISIPFVALFDLERWVVRLPNALLGVGAIYITYLFVVEISRRTSFARIYGGNKIGIVAATLLAISSWHVMMSRGAFEANLTTFLLPLVQRFE
jgi:4-amino-4-deoxy-L-arabinose transferase-like glycosyltransferase